MNAVNVFAESASSERAEEIQEVSKQEVSPSQNGSKEEKPKGSEGSPSIAKVNQSGIRARGLGRLAQRDSALRPPVGSWSIGLFNPLKIQISDRWAIETHPLTALFVAPHLKLWQQWWSNREMTLQGLYGFSTPSWSLQRGIPFGLAGYLSPSCLVSEEEPDRAPSSCQRPGFDIAPLFGARLSGRQAGGVWTIQGDLALGLMINGDRLAPLDSYAPVEMVFSPTSNRYRAHLGFSYAHPVARSISVKLEADLYSVGQADEKIAPSKSPLTVSSQLSFDWALSEHLSLTFGSIAWLSDQRAFDLLEDKNGFVQKTAKMSFDLFPTFDLLWHY